MTSNVKLVKEVFGDFNSRTNIVKCGIISINIFKKTNKLAIVLHSDVQIGMGEILEFEMYLKNKFKV